LARGSRKHVLDWTGSPDFIQQFTEVLAPAPVEILATDRMMPRGDAAPSEARLDRVGPIWQPEADWDAFQDWWLVHRRGANTPNWDIAVGCTIGGTRGFVLVEAKANWPELSKAGKPLSDSSSEASRENDECIRGAVSEASHGWSAISPDIRLTCDSHYQLANRLAVTWKLASMGIPVVLMYLGFTGDDGIRDAGAPFADQADWDAAFASYAADVVPLSIFDSRLLIHDTPVWLLSRARPVIEASGPAVS